MPPGLLVMCGKQDLCLDQNTHAIPTTEGEQHLIDTFVLPDLPSPSSQAKSIATENLFKPCPFGFNQQNRWSIGVEPMAWRKMADL